MKEDTSYKYYILATALYIFECWLLYYLKYRVYGNEIFGSGVETMFFNFLIFPPIFAISYALRKDKIEQDKNDPKKMKQQRIVSIVLNIFLVALIIGFLVWDIGNVYTFSFYLLIFLELIMVATFIFNKIYPNVRANLTKAMSVSLLFFSIIAITLSYPVVVHPATVKEATQTLTEAGYSDIQYQGIRSRIFYEVSFMDKEVTDFVPIPRDYILVSEIDEHEDILNFYTFEGRLNGEPRCVQVSVLKGRITSYYKIEEENGDFYGSTE